ncbi:MAG: hypothetical protein J6Y75_05895 [Spirochaetaceae bacterium]|nr:hypothetical protein [Spirochaetaceae bacterium]MBP5329414.1 hypothetical protein [Spirochaetaceae bacterium]
MKRGLLFSSIILMVIASVCLCGCGKGKEAEKSTGGLKPITLDIYDVAANYQGLQSGWFGKIVKDKFNIELNIIAPQVAGDAIFQTRASSGNLGDIVILEATQFNDCLSAGLIKDISDKITSSPNLMKFNKQIKTFNEALPGNSAGKYYGIPTEMMDTSPTSVTQERIYSLPQLRWDLYNKIGAPELKNLDDLLNAFVELRKVHPTNEKGDPAYPLSLWPDWDGGDGMIGIANVVQLTTWYGDKIKGSAVLRPDGTFYPLTDKAGAYYKMLKFLNKARRMGVVDPDSGTQDWNSVCAKISNGQVDFIWYTWEIGFWNTTARYSDGTAFCFIPVKDQLYYTDSDAYFGSGRVFGVGSNVDPEKYERIMQFLDWYASPEGCEYQHIGLKGFNYEVLSNGKYNQINDNALMDNLPVPDEFGGGGYSDGNNAINQWICKSECTNPNTGEIYAPQYWASTKERNMTQMRRDWEKKYDATDATNWMVKNNKITVSPSVSVSLPSDDPDISVIRNSVNQEVCDASWRMIFAKDDAEFDKMWDAMTKEVKGFGFDQLYAFDCKKHQIEVDAKAKVK